MHFSNGICPKQMHLMEWNDMKLFFVVVFNFIDSISENINNCCFEACAQNYICHSIENYVFKNIFIYGMEH